MKKSQLVTGFTSSNFKQWLGSKKISFLAGINRSIDPAQVTKLAKSIDAIGTQRTIVIAELSFITGKTEWYIIDGQHLYHALMRNGSDIPYVVVEIKDKADLVEKIALLNASSKSWCTQDYITAWSCLKTDYVKLNEYLNRYDLEKSFTASILMNRGYDGSEIIRDIKRGEFKIINEEANVLILDYITDVLRIIPRQNRTENRYLCREFLKFLKSCADYDHVRFIKNITKVKDEFKFATQESGKLSDFFYKLK
jgi:hypothetical protein